MSGAISGEKANKNRIGGAISEKSRTIISDHPRKLIPIQKKSKSKRKNPSIPALFVSYLLCELVSSCSELLDRLEYVVHIVLRGVAVAVVLLIVGAVPGSGHKA